MDKKTKQELLKSKLMRWWQTDSNARKGIDWKWYMYDLYFRGYHYAKYDRGTQQILINANNDGRPKVVVNKILSTVRGVTNYALRNRPKAEVTPADLNMDNLGEIVKMNTFLDFMHDRLGLREIERGSVEESIVSGISWVQVLWDENADEGQGQIAVNEIDKYDLYWEASARTPKEARRFTLAVSRNIDDLRRDPKYKGTDWDAIKPDNLTSSSTLRSRLLQMEKSTTAGAATEQHNSVVVKEFWYYGDKELGEDPDKIYICAMAGDEIIRQPEETDLTRMPFFRLCTSKNKLEMVGESWIRDLIHLNKRLNHLMSSLAEYNLIMNKGMWTMPKGAYVRTIKAEHGIIIEHKQGAGFEPHHVAIQPLSAAIYQEIDKILMMFEDIGAFHDATAGRVPVSAKSGKAIEALQVGDSNNLAEIVENVEIWLEEIYEYIMILAAQKYQYAREITPISKTSQREFISVIGEEAQAKPSNAVVIRKKNIVDVKITSYLAHTAEARREAVKELSTIIPDLDPQTILEVYEVGPIGDVIKRIMENRERRLAEEEQKAQIQAQAGQPTGAGAQKAIADIRQVIENGQMPQNTQVSEEYIETFDQFLARESQMGELEPEILSQLQQIRDMAVSQVA